MFPRLLFWLVTALAGSLLALVLVAPLVDSPAGGLGRLLTLFAEDGTVRKTAVAGGLGMLVTACVFFRPPPDDRPRKRRAAPPRDAVGA